jgi:hypothetical protein
MTYSEIEHLLRRVLMTEGVGLSPEQKVALVTLFNSVFELGYRQGLEGATPADNDRFIRSTLRETVDRLSRSLDEAHFAD